MGVIKGITVVLVDRNQTGVDPFGKPLFDEVETPVENVLVAPAASDDVINTLNLTGKKAEYTLAIPKGDTHDWTDHEVRFFAQRWHVIGIPLEGIDALIPLAWNKKVTVERYA